MRLNNCVLLAENALKGWTATISANLVGFSATKQMETVWLRSKGPRTEGKIVLR